MCTYEEKPIIKIEIDEVTSVETTVPSSFEESNCKDLHLVEFELLLDKNNADAEITGIHGNIDQIDDQLELIEAQVSKLNEDIDKLTNHADGFDYTVAVGCGVLTGAIDAILVGAFDFDSSVENVNNFFQNIVSKEADKVQERLKNEKINEAIENAKQKAAEKGEVLSAEKIQEITDKISQSFERKMQDLSNFAGDDRNKEFARKVRILEDAYSIPSDNSWNGAGIGVDAKSHHLDDLAHHPTLLGWLASMATQFTETAYFHNKEGDNFKIKVQKTKTVKKGKQEITIQLIGTDLQSKLVCGTLNWLGHLISDMAGSQSSARKGNLGMGLPGPLLATIEEISRLPFLKQTSLSQLVHDLFTSDNAIFGKYRMDLRSELAIGVELGKQAIPVLINTVLVRSFYFMRCLINEAKEAKKIYDVNWSKITPWGNRTVTRMLTISLGTFEAIDIADAGIRAMIETKGVNAATAGKFILRVNFVGIGRFAIAVGSDVSMEVKRNKKQNERIRLNNVRLQYLNAKVFYRQAEMWNLAESTRDSIQEAYRAMEDAIEEFYNALEQNQASMENIGRYLPDAEQKNPGLMNEMFELLYWG